MGDERRNEGPSAATKIELPNFPGERVLAHEGRNWRIAAITRLAPHELVVVAETGIPPAANEIIDIDLDEFPELDPSHPHYERRKDIRTRYLGERINKTSRGGHA